MPRASTDSRPTTTCICLLTRRRIIGHTRSACEVIGLSAIDADGNHINRAGAGTNLACPLKPAMTSAWIVRIAALVGIIIVRFACRHAAQTICSIRNARAFAGAGEVRFACGGTAQPVSRVRGAALWRRFAGRFSRIALARVSAAHSISGNGLAAFRRGRWAARFGGITFPCGRAAESVCRISDTSAFAGAGEVGFARFRAANAIG